MQVPLTPLALVARGMDAFPHLPAVIDDGRLLTYADLRQEAERLAHGLITWGLTPGERVAILSPNVAEALVAYLAVPLAGGVLVPLNTRLVADDYRYILGHAECAFALIHPELSPRALPLAGERPEMRVAILGEGEPGLPSYRDLTAVPPPLPFDWRSYPEANVLSINYTSGTTSRPKGVVQTHRNNHLNAVDMLLATGIGRGDRHLHVAPLFHANGWGMIWTTLAVGAANVMLPRVSASDIHRRIAEFAVTSLNATATVLVMLLEERPTQVRPGVLVIAGGAAPPAGVIRRIETELGWRLLHMYGLTETTAFLTAFEEPPDYPRLDPAERARLKARQGTVLPLAGEVRVVRADMADVACDGLEMGEVVARGNVIMKGYHRDPDATERAFARGWFHTGDLAVRHPDGTVEIRDRAKDVIISGGENIPSLEVEGVLFTHPGIAEAAVVAAPHPKWGETPVAFVVPRRGVEVDAEEVIAYCRERLPHFKAPTRVIFRSELPRTGSGKVQKFALRRELADGND